jgi:hypothetical protein
MNEQQLNAVKQALEVLEKDVRFYKTEKQAAITALQSIISQDAIYKMAEESRTNGLRLDDWDKIGCVNHDCDECKAVQSAERGEPFGYLEIDDIESQREYPNNCRNVNLWHEGGEGMTAIYIAPPIVATPLAAQKPWEGLTDAELYEIGGFKSTHGYVPTPFKRMMKEFEAKLKEKNT